MCAAKRKALIIGGGVGGLTAALALRRSGWAVEVFEQAPLLREVGSGFMLSPNAMSVLFGPGLQHVVERGAKATRFDMCSWRGEALMIRRRGRAPGGAAGALRG